MLNEFGSYADAIDNATKTDLSRKSVVASSDRSSCCVAGGVSSTVSNVSDVAPRQVPSSGAWNCNPYLGNFYNYYGANGYDVPAPGGDVHQYDGQKCATVNQFGRGYAQPAIQSASVLQCCDPRCQLISDHAKYPFSNDLVNKYNNQRVKSSARKACYGLESAKGELNGHPITSFPYPGVGSQHDLNKYNGQQQQQQQAQHQQQHYGAMYQSPVKASKHVLLPSETSSFGDYYTDIGKPAYWKQNVWNRGMSTSYYGPTEMPKMANSMHEQNNSSASQRGILFNRLLERRNRAMYDMSYMPNYHYGRHPPPPPPPPVSKTQAYCQSYGTDRDLYADCGNTRVPLQNNSYQTLPMYCVDPPAIPKDTKDNHRHDNQSNTKSRILDKPNLDVREFLSTWDDVEDDKAPEPETPVIVLDCTSLEGDALAKVKEKLGDTVTNLTNSQNDFNSQSAATVLKVVDDHNATISAHTSVIQESVVNDTMVSKKDKYDKTLDSSHTSDHYNGAMWYGQQPLPQPAKKKDDLSYDLVEMTERLVNTVDKLFGDEKCEPKNAYYETRREDVAKDDQWNINLNYKRNKVDKITPPSVTPDAKYKPKEDFVYKPPPPPLLPDYDKEPEKNVSCSFNLQKTNNDLKFSVNYSKQTECYSSRVQDYSVKYKNYEPAKAKPRVEDYSYKNYYNSYYYNNPSCEYMQMENVKECTYDVESIDNHNASDITLVKADLEKSLKEITHQFSYQKKPEPEKLPKSPVRDIPEQMDTMESACADNTVLPTSVIQKTGSCPEKVLDERDESFNDNSMLSMPSLSPPSCPPPAPSKVGLTLNDVYDDNVIFDTMNSTSKPGEEPQLDFTNVLKKADAERDSVVYPLNLALTKQTKESQPSVLKFTSTTSEDNTEADGVKVDDGYYSVETHSEKDVSADSDEAKKSTNGDVQQPVYKTCIVSREHYEHPDRLPQAVNEGLPVLEPTKVVEPTEYSLALNLAKDTQEDSGSRPLSDTESLGKPDDVFGKLHNSSTDDEKLLKSSKFKKYKKHKKMKCKKEQVQSNSVIKENGNVTRFKHIFPNIQACSEEAFISNQQKAESTRRLAILSACSIDDTPQAPSLPILVTEEADQPNNYNIKKRKFASFVKDADLPVKKRKQDRMVGVDSKASEQRIVVSEPDQEESSLNGKYPRESVDHVDAVEPTLCTTTESNEDDDDGKKAKKKHKKDKNRLKIKFKKQKKKDKTTEEGAEGVLVDAKSPDRAMSNDETVDPCKFQSSGSEVVRLNGDNHVVSGHAIQSNVHPNTDVFEPVENHVLDINATNEDVIDGDKSPLHLEPDDGKCQIEQSRENDNCNENFHTSSSSENFKSHHVSDNEANDAFNIDQSPRKVINEDSSIGISNEEELRDDIRTVTEDHSEPEDVADSPKGRDSGFNEPEVQNDEANSPLCFSPQFSVFKNKLSPLKDSPPYDASLGHQSNDLESNDLESPLALCVDRTCPSTSPKPNTNVESPKSPNTDPIDQSSELKCLENEVPPVSPIPETLKCSPLGTPVRSESLEKLESNDRIASGNAIEPSYKVEENSPSALEDTAVAGSPEPSLGPSWSKEPSPVHCDKNDTNWNKCSPNKESPIARDQDDTTKWTKIPEKSIWSCENSPEPSPRDIPWSPVPVVQSIAAEEPPGSMDWCRDHSPLPFDQNVDHEEAISDAEETRKSIWSDANSPSASEDGSPVRFTECDHQTVISNAITEYPMSPWSSRSNSISERRSSESDSDDSDSSSSSSSSSPSKSSKSSCCKHSMECADDESTKKSDSSCDSCDDEGEHECPGIDYLFNIPSVAPTPHCELNKDECVEDSGELDGDRSKAPSPNLDLHEEPFGELKLNKAPSPFCILNDNETEALVNRVQRGDNDDQSSRQYFSDQSSVSSVAPSPYCDIIDGVLLDDTDTGGFDKPSPQPIQIHQVPTLRDLAARSLAEMSLNAVPSFNRLEVWVTPDRTEIIIHSDDVEPNHTDLVIANDNHVMITDAYEDDDVNIASNFDKINEISFDYAMDVEASDADKSEEELQCQCLIISSEESIVCLRCSLNSSIIVNQDLDIEHYANEPDSVAYDNEIPTITDDPWNTPNESNCIEDLFIDHKINVTPEHYEPLTCPFNQSHTSVDEDKAADNEVRTITDSQPRIRKSRNDIQIKVQLPWHKIFNLTTIGQDNQKTLELGPAQIEVRLSPDDANLWKLVNSKNERVSPVVQVKRLILRASDSPLPEKRASPVQSVHSDREESSCDPPKLAESSKPSSEISRLPKMVIKKTSCKEYKSFLQLNTMQPVVKLYKSRRLDELALKMRQQNVFSVNLKQLKIDSSMESIPEEVADQVDRLEQLDEHEVTTKQKEIEITKAEDTGSTMDLVTMLDTTPPRDVGTKPERHHCLLCHRSFTCEQAYQVHVKGRFHRHLELTQRKTIHAMYRHFTGHICPRLRPLSTKERKRMKWKPRSANVNHFYHQKTPLQIALHKSVFENKRNSGEERS